MADLTPEEKERRDLEDIELILLGKLCDWCGGTKVLVTTTGYRAFNDPIQETTPCHWCKAKGYTWTENSKRSSR